VNILIVADAYPPLHTSCATLIHDLGLSLVGIGCNVVIAVPSSSQAASILVEKAPGLVLIRIKAFQTKDVNYIHRFLAELINPYVMWWRLKGCSEIRGKKIDGVVWYSPSIFFGPLVKRLKREFSCRSYLILRDIFPDWALDLGVLKKGITFNLLKSIEKYQYEQADKIGVQSPNNLTYFKAHHPKLSTRVEVLWNWVRPAIGSKASFELSKTKLAGKKILVYAGNIGAAQGVYSFVEMAIALNKLKEGIGYLFVGRGSEVGRLKSAFVKNNIENVLFMDEVDSSEIPNLLSQCSIGLVGLDSRHTTHNIPGKFFSYLQSGLAVIVIANKGNDLKELIEDSKLGVFGEEVNNDLILQALNLIDSISVNSKNLLKKNYLDLAQGVFSPETAALQISGAFNK